MRWYAYRQNNSGGYRLGPAETVVVHAADVEHANERALAVGVNPNAPFCDCCGRRWSLLYPDDLIEGIDVADTLSGLSEFHDLWNARVEA